MKICIVGNAQSVHVVKWVNWFSKNHEVHVLTDYMADIPNVTVHSIGGGQGAVALIRKALKARKIIRQLQPDIIHAHYASSYGMMGALSGRHPFLVSAWGSDVTADSYDALKRIPLKFALGRADLISAYDAVLVKRLAELGFPNVIRKRIVGIDLDMFSKNRSVNNLPGMGAKPGHMLMCARPLDARGGVETLIRAMPKVTQRFPDTRLMLIYLKGEQEQAFKDLAGSLGVKNNVVFVGKVEHQVMPGLLAASDIFVDTFSSGNKMRDDVDRYPGLGAAAMEAMACGTPVVIPVTEVTADLDCPYVTYVHGNPDSLAEAIIGLCQEHHHATMAGKGIDYIKAMAANDKIMGEWEEIYSSSVNK
jgi:L-malate glycosyltransferase